MWVLESLTSITSMSFMRSTLKWLLAMFLLAFIGSGCSVSDVLLGVEGGSLKECPSSPNCVSSQTLDSEKSMSPLPMSGNVESSKQKILAIINSMNRTRIVSETGDYLHVEFRSALFRFVDDVEFFFDERENTIHFRSASRTGYSDMGVNRKRMTEISKQYLTELE